MIDAEFKWVVRAVANSREPREHLRYVYSDGRNLMACDGHRLHISNKAYPFGWYTPEGQKVHGCTLLFPDVQSIVINRAPAADQVRSDRFGPVQREMIKINDTWFNPRYLHEAACSHTTINIATEKFDDWWSENPCRIHCKHGTAFVMPINPSNSMGDNEHD